MLKKTLRVLPSIVLLSMASGCESGAYDEDAAAGPVQSVPDAPELQAGSRAGVPDAPESAPDAPALRAGALVEHLRDTATASSCGDGVCSTEEKANPTSCPSDCISAYSSFESDLQTVLRRSDNTKRAVNLTAKQDSVNRMLRFAGSLGLSTRGISPTATGRQYQTLQNTAGDIDAYLVVTQNVDTRDQDEGVVARRTWANRPGAQPISDRDLASLTARAMGTYGVPTASGDTTTAVGPLQVVADDDEGSVVLDQNQGYSRSFGGRQVINSTFRVEIDNSTAATSGMSLRNWWPVGGASGVALKSTTQLGNDVKLALAQGAGASSSIMIRACRPTYFQMSTVLIPTVTCSAREENRTDEEAAAEPLSVTVSVASEYSVDERRTTVEASTPDSQAPKSGDSLISSGFDGQAAEMSLREYGSQSEGLTASSFPSTYSMYSDAETRFYYGAKEFYNDYFLYSNRYISHSWVDYFYGMNGPKYVDNVDLAFVTGHGGMRSIGGQDGSIVTNAAEATDSSQLGTNNLEYLLFTGCTTASAIHCGGMSARTRYTDNATRDSIFNGLHHFGSNHGTRMSGISILKSAAANVAFLLEIGIPVVEAWSEGENASDSWYSGEECHKATSPDSNCKTSEFSCDRWGVYPSIFFTKGKQNESMINRASYTTDAHPGDASYSVRNIYYYQSDDSRIPIYAPGFALGK